MQLIDLGDQTDRYNQLIMEIDLRDKLILKTIGHDQLILEIDRSNQQLTIKTYRSDKSITKTDRRNQPIMVNNRCDQLIARSKLFGTNFPFRSRTLDIKTKVVL